MISGIGVDLVDKARFINLVKKFGNRVATKILSKDEYLEYKDISNKPSFLSKRFAAKEALSKALGVGLYRKGIYPKYISVKHDDFGEGKVLGINGKKLQVKFKKFEEIMSIFSDFVKKQ